MQDWRNQAHTYPFVTEDGIRVFVTLTKNISRPWLPSRFNVMFWPYGEVGSWLGIQSFDFAEDEQHKIDRLIDQMLEVYRSGPPPEFANPAPAIPLPP